MSERALTLRRFAATVKGPVHDAMIDGANVIEELENEIRQLKSLAKARKDQVRTLEDRAGMSKISGEA